jgi:hypothetical protein
MDSSKNLPWKAFKDLIATRDLPDIGPQPRAERLPLAELESALVRFENGAGLPSALRLPLRAAALLWHDYLEESHRISQELHTPAGSFLHGIMHRREPDYGNAKYWFHRVGRHACFPEIAKQVLRLLAAEDKKEWAAKLAPRGDWDPFAFVDACEGAAGQFSSEQRVPTLKAIQEIEFDCLLAHLFAT